VVPAKPAPANPPDSVRDEEQTAQLANWLVAIARGDERALEKFYDATLSRVYAVARRMCGSRDGGLTEEVTADVYVQVWRDAERFDAARGLPMAWLLMIARLRALDALRRRDEAVGSDDPHALAGEPGSDIGDPAELLEAFDRCSATRRALAQLPAPERQLVALAFFRGMTHAEIVQETGMPLGTVKTTIRRALSTLRALLGEHAPESIGPRNNDDYANEIRN
jgi:RNA polymerase sigma-70 factor (ECF subfamily)